MKKLFLLTAFIAFLSFNSFAQTPPCDSTGWAREGTYEFIRLEKVEEVFFNDILCWIETQRHEVKVVEITLSPYTIVRIFPRSEISWRAKN
jgi:hypothetical protein